MIPINASKIQLVTLYVEFLVDDREVLINFFQFLFLFNSNRRTYRFLVIGSRSRGRFLEEGDREGGRFRNAAPWSRNHSAYDN